MSVRGQLLFGGAGAIVALAAVSAVSLVFAGRVNVNAARSSRTFAAVGQLQRTYQSWLLDDDQSNMYASLVALRQPSQHALAEATWAQAVAAYRQTVTGLQRLRGMVGDPADQRAVARLQSTLSAYNVFSGELRAAALAGRVDHAVWIMSVGNLGPSNALPAEFSALRDALQHHANVDQAAVRQAAHTGSTMVVIVSTASVVLLVLLVLVIMQTVRVGMRRAIDRLGEMERAVDLNLLPGLQALAHGDLTRRLEPMTRPQSDFPAGDIGLMLRATEALREGLVSSYGAYNDSVKELRSLVGTVAGSAAAVGAASEQMHATSEESGRVTSEVARAVSEIAQGAEQQVGMLDEARRLVETVSAAAADSVSSAEDTALAAQETSTLARAGLDAAARAAQAMGAVSESTAAVTEAIDRLASMSEQIGKIVQTVTTIAEQTNLLALNAAIEAARAGDQGQGFAVVAEEVRRLAEGSQQAAQEIATLISSVQAETGHVVAVVQDGAQRTEHGAGIVAQARESFDQIDRAISNITERMGDVAAVSNTIATNVQAMHRTIDEIASVAEQSSASTQQVSASTEQTTAAAQQIAASAADLADGADRLRALIGQFTTGEHDLTRG